MQVAWLRLFYQYGPFEHERRLMPTVIRALLHNQSVKITKGKQIRDFLHVEDVAAAIWTVARSDLSGPVNIGSGQPVAVRDIVTQIGLILGVLPPSIKLLSRDHLRHFENQTALFFRVLPVSLENVEVLSRLAAFIHEKRVEGIIDFKDSKMLEILLHALNRKGLFNKGFSADGV